jgi:hypothetical protein
MSVITSQSTEAWVVGVSMAVPFLMDTIKTFRGGQGWMGALLLLVGSVLTSTVSIYTYEETQNSTALMKRMIMIGIPIVALCSGALVFFSSPLGFSLMSVGLFAAALILFKIIDGAQADNKTSDVTRNLLVFGVPVVLLLAIVLPLCIFRVRQHQCGVTLEDALHTQPFARGASKTPLYTPQPCDKAKPTCTFTSDLFTKDKRLITIQDGGRCFEIPPKFWWEYAFPPEQMFLRFGLLALFVAFASYTAFTLFQRGFFSTHDIYSWVHCDTADRNKCNTAISQSFAASHDQIRRSHK